MFRFPPERGAQVAMVVLLLAVGRTLADYARIRRALGPEVAASAFAPLMVGVTIAIGGLVGALAFYFRRQYRAATSTVALAVLLTLAYRILASR